MRDLDIIFGTWNRLELLKRCVASVRRSVGRLKYKIVIIDAGSTDGSREWLLEQAEDYGDIKHLFEEERRGATRAYNDAYKATSAPFVQMLNDDVEVLDLALERAHGRISGDAEIGQLALSYRSTKQCAFRSYTIHGKPYANYGMVRREAADQVVEIQGGVWNPRYHTYAADTELSCWLHKLGWRVVAAGDLHLFDHEAQGELRVSNNSGRNAQDSAWFGRRWPSPRHLEPGGPDPLVTPDELAAFHAVCAR